MKMYTALAIFCFCVTVTCAPQDHGVRLSNITRTKGIVEVYHDGQWGTICRDGWDFYDALVVCKQLGFNWLAENGWNDIEGKGSGPVWLSNVQCNGSQSALDLCVNDESWVNHTDCSDQINSATATCADDLAGYYLYFIHAGGGSLSNEGQVLLNLPYTGSYPDPRFLICSQGWNLDDANVVCRQNGFNTGRGSTNAYRVTTDNYFGKPLLGDYHWAPLYDNPDSPVPPYLAMEFGCTGNEGNLLECPAQAWFMDDCPSGSAAGVSCNREEEPEGFQLRLVNGTTDNEGRLEIFFNGTWGRGCVNSGGIGYRETNVICQQLGRGYGLEAPADDRFGVSSQPVVIDSASCDGGEPSLAQCWHRDWQHMAMDECWPTYFEMNVICSSPLSESRSPVRFATDYQMDMGNVAIYHDGRWGTICNNGWTMANSQVVCRELGLGPPLQATVDLGPERSGGPIFLGSVSCKGDEATLDQCELGEWYQHECDHNMDVATICGPVVVSVAGVVSANVPLIMLTLMSLHRMTWIVEVK